MRNILRTVAGVVIFLTGFFYIFGKSNEGYAAETKSPPIRQELVHEYARKQVPLARASHAATYACHEVTSDCDFSRDLRNTEGCWKFTDGSPSGPFVCAGTHKSSLLSTASSGSAYHPIASG